MKKHVLLMVAGKDQPGIIAKVTELLYKNHCNLEDISMTVLEGTLAMILVVSVPAGRQRRLQVQSADFERKTGLSLTWKPIRGFLRRGENLRSNLYMVSAIGRDRTGIVYHVSRILAVHKSNIVDLNSKILGRGTKTLYALALEVEILNPALVKRIQKSLHAIGKKLKLDIHLTPVERLTL